MDERGRYSVASSRFSVWRFGYCSNCIPISFGRWISQVTPTYPLELPAVSACAFQEPWACRQRWSWDAFRLRSSLPCRGISDSRSCLPRVWPTRRTWHLEWNMCHLLRSDAWIIVSLWSLTPERWLRAMHLEFHLLAANDFCHSITFCYSPDLTRISKKHCGEWRSMAWCRPFI